MPERRISSLAITTDITSGGISIKVSLEGKPVAGESLSVAVMDGGKQVAEAKGDLTLKVPQPKFWSPGSPHLYDLKVTLSNAGGTTIDQVASPSLIK